MVENFGGNTPKSNDWENEQFDDIVSDFTLPHKRKTNNYSWTRHH